MVSEEYKNPTEYIESKNIRAYITPQKNPKEFI